MVATQGQPVTKAPVLGGRRPAPSSRRISSVNVPVVRPTPTPNVSAPTMSGHSMGGAAFTPSTAPISAPVTTAPVMPSTAPQPPTFGPMAAAMERYKPTDNPFSAIAQGFVNANSENEQYAADAAKKAQVADALKAHPDLARYVQSGAIDAVDAIRLAEDRDEKVRLTAEDTKKRKTVAELLRKQGETALADQVEAGLVGLDSVADYFKKPKPTDDQSEYQSYVDQETAGGTPPEQIMSFGQWQGKTPTIGTEANRPIVTIGSDGKADPVAQAAFLESLSPEDATLVKQIANYQVDITKATSMRGKGTASERQRMATLVSQYDPTYDMTQYPARAAMQKSITSGTYSQTLNSANLVIQHLDALSGAFQQLHNQGGLLTPWNAVANPFKQATGDANIKNVQQAADAVASELAKVFKGSGVSSEEEIKHWRANLDPNMSPEQMDASVKFLIGELLKSRLDTVRAQYQSAMGHPQDFAFLTPHSKEVLTKLGIDPATLDNSTSSAIPFDTTGLDRTGIDTQKGADQSAAPAKLPEPQTQEEVDALKPGQHYLDNGVEMIKS